MLTRLVVRNFKMLEEADIELGQNVVFIGPNNSGKTSALQALALWQTGVRECLVRFQFAPPGVRQWVTINRKNITHTPVREAKHLWRLANARWVKPQTVFEDPAFPRLEIAVEGQDLQEQWGIRLVFSFRDPESVHCTPIFDTAIGEQTQLWSALQTAAKTRVALLPPMAGLTAEEEELQPGRIDVLIGEGQTARVLRNLCLRVSEQSPNAWETIVGRLRQMFGLSLGDPQRDPSRGTIELNYQHNDVELDIASAGRGLQQTLLLLAHMHANPGATLLLDEPDAHLEVLRQREIYNVLTDTAQATGSQLIVASHSEILMNEAAGRHVVIGFLGKPHRVNKQTGELLKSLTSIGWDQYVQAEARAGVLYLEGPTDLAMLLAFAERLEHPAREVLREPFTHYVGNQPNKAAEHYFGLREAKPSLRAFVLMDRRENGLPTGFSIPAHCWQRREIENYVTNRDVLMAFAAGRPGDEAIDRADSVKRADAMRTSLDQVESAQSTLGHDAWGRDIKASEEVLPAVFRLFYKNLGLRNEMNKADFHELVAFIDPAKIDPEITGVLDRINEILRETS